MNTLTTEDHIAMHDAGYCVNLRFDGFRLERLPQTGVFKDDACVWLHVFDLAMERVPIGLTVLTFLQEHEPLEFKLIAQYAAIYRPNQVAHLQQAA